MDAQGHRLGQRRPDMARIQALLVKTMTDLVQNAVE